MVFFSKPADQDRFNATVYELVRMRFDGAACVDGWWDPHDTLSYLERRMKLEIIPTLRSDGSLFYINGKRVLFLENGVIVSASKGDIRS